MFTADDYFDAAELGLETLNPYINVNISESDRAGYVLAVVTVEEQMRFHSELDSSTWDGAPEYLVPERRMFDSEGQLTTDAARILTSLIEHRYAGEYLEETGDGEDYAVRFDLTVEVPEDADVDTLSELIWEETKLVQFHNEADPGTFGSDYLFSLVQDQLNLMG